MKTKMLFIAVAILLGSVQMIEAQNKEKEVYAFTYAYSYSYKYMYVSPVVSGYINSDRYFDANNNGLRVQWTDKLKTFLDKYYDYQLTTFGFYDYDTVDNERTKWIGKFKQEGFSIRYVDDFWYKSSKRGE